MWEHPVCVEIVIWLIYWLYVGTFCPAAEFIGWRCIILLHASLYKLIDSLKLIGCKNVEMLKCLFPTVECQLITLKC